MKILITGATGLVGRSLVALCHQEGIRVHYLTTSKQKIVSKPDYQGFYWNPSLNEIDTKAFQGVDTIVHLAGASIAQRWTKANKQSIKDSRIKSAKLIYESLESFRESGNPHSIKHIISASAIGCYPSSQTNYYDEEHKGYANGFLGEVVKEWETAILNFEKLEIQTTLVRTGIILDKKGGALPKIMQPIEMYAGAPASTGKQWQSWVHIEDMSRMYLYLIKNKLEGIYNGVAPNPVTNEKLTKVAAQTIGKPLLLPNIPAFVLKMILGEMSTIALESQKVCSDKIMDSGFTFNYPTLENALSNILK